MFDIFKTLLDEIVVRPKEGKPTTSVTKSFQYRIYQEHGFWRYWIKMPILHIQIICSKTFVSKEMAKENMDFVLSEMGWQIKATRTTE